MKTRIFLSMMLLLCYFYPNAQIQNINRVEYFIDKDPGFGKGTSLAITPGILVSGKYSIALSSLDIQDGIHLFSVRAKDGNNRWSATTSSVFVKEKITSNIPLGNISYAEYFLDNDPGYGKGNPVTLTAGTSLTNHTFTAALPSNIFEGLHFLTVRYKDSNGRWGVPVVKIILKDKIDIAQSPLSPIVALEYFIDNDPGYDKAISIPFDKGNTINNLTFSIPLPASLSKGVHNINVRAKDLTGNWSAVVVRTIYNETIPIPTVLAKTVKIEYFIDKDPGYGKGIDIPFATGTEVNNISFTANLTGILTGDHQLFIRSKDEKGNWSTVGNRNFTICADAVKLQITTLNPLTFCEGKSAILSVPAGYKYQWQKNGEDIYDAISNSYEAKYAGDYQVIVINKSCMMTTNPVTVSTLPFPQKPEILVPSQSVCLGNSVVLEAKGCNGTLTWINEGKIVDKLITPTKSGIYNAICNSNGCSSELSDNLTVTVNPVLNPPTIAGPNTEVCQGSIVSLTTTGCSGTVVWNDLSEGTSLTVRPNTTTTYSASCKTNTCTSSTSSFTVKVKSSSANQMVISGVNQTICSGVSVNLSSNGCTGNILWSTGATTKDIVVTPSANTTYSATCTQNGCTGNAANTVKITVIPTSPALEIKATEVNICKGKSTVLTTGFCYGTTVWSDGSIGRNIIAKPEITTNYTANCVYNGCKNTPSNAITINVTDCENRSGLTSKIIALEYFIDTDPGVGNASSIGIPTNLSQLDKTFEIPLTNDLADGFHTVSVRVKDSEGRWSPVVIRPFVKQAILAPLPNITQIEYFFDNDPGYGNGIQVAIPQQAVLSNFNINVPVSSSLADGIHFLNVRVKDSYERWGANVVRVFVKNALQTSVALTNITQLEYFVDNDPGNGSGIPIQFTKGQSISNLSFEVNLKSLSLVDGEHFLQIRAKDEDGNWSSIGMKTFTSSNEIIKLGTFANVLCNQKTVEISYDIEGNFNVGNEFVVQLSDATGNFSDSPDELGRVLSTKKGTITSLLPNLVGNYKIRVVSTNPMRYSDPQYILLKQKPFKPTISNGSSTDFCKGGSVLLTATNFEGQIKWSNNSTASKISISALGQYYAIATLDGCVSDTSNLITITNSTAPQTPIISTAIKTLCLGQSTSIGAQNCEGIVTWTGGLTGNSITVTPSKTASYKALCTVNGCKSDSSTAVTITVTPKPTTPIVKANNTNLCIGTSAVLSSTGCTGIVSWTSGLTGGSVTVTPTKTTSYKALCIVNGCQSDSSLAVTITVISKPAQTKITTSNSSICAGGSSVLTASACTGGILTWTGNLTGSTVTVTPSKTSTYKALCTVNGCKSDSSTAVTITVTPKPTTPVAKSNNSSVCLGNVAILSATGCAGTVTWTGNLTGTSVTVTPTKTSTYKALCTVNGCKSDSSTAVTITVTPKLATPVAKSNNSSICQGTSAVLTSTGCAGTVTWTGNLPGSTVTVTPNKTSTYKALCTVNGCKSDSSTAVTITVSPKPTTPVAKSNNSSVCLGNIAVLSATGCSGLVTWTGNLTGTSVTVTPTKTSTYKALCTVNGCKSDSSTAVTITVNPKPTTPVAKSNNSSVCLGNVAILSATGCGGTVAWTGNLTGSSVTVTPTKTSSYKALCTVNGCKSDSSTAVTITVSPKPTTPIAKSNNASVCLGNIAVLTATGCDGTVTWTGNLTGSTVTVTPPKTSTYKALCTVNGCKSDSSTAVTITVSPKPVTPVAKSNYSSVCLGNVAVLSATGCAGTVTWTGNLTGSSVTVTPNKTSTYKALCTVNGCKSDSSTAVTITVTPKPTTPVAKSNNSSVCLGNVAVLSATGCGGTVTWTGNLTGSTVTVTPPKTSTYKALCTVNGCKSDSSTAVTITVSPKPVTPVAKSNNSSVCLGTSAVLTATGCSGVVTWTGNLTGSSVTVTPNKTSTYKALCTVNGCKSDSSTAVTITVSPKPTTPVAKSNNASVCLGNVAILSATGCAGTVTWTGNLTGTSVTVTPTKTSTYKALCTVNGCKSDSSTAVTITVTPKPTTPVAKSNNSSVCLGNVAILSATGCGGTVAWTGNLTGSSVTVTPNKTSTYKALCTVNGCKSDSSTAVTITVTPKPTTPIAKSNNASVCLGTSTVLTATGCTGTLTWTGSLTGTSVTVTPSRTSTYKALCTVNGCKSDSSTAVTITVSPKPTTTVAKSNNASVCLGNVAILSATGCAGTVTWTGNLTGSSVTVTPSKTSSYKALCTVNGCKSDSSVAVTITVTPKPTTPVAKSNNSSLCLGTSTVLTATGCTGTLTWTGNLTGSSVTVTPTKTSTYKALCTVNGCKSDSSTAVTITVTPKPATPVAKSNNSSVCLGTNAILSATGCAGTVTWTGNLTGTSVTVTPTKTSTYKALCTVNGCKSDSSTAVTITVTPKPVTPVAKSNNSSVCLGTNAILSATGCAGTVTWTGNLTGSSVMVTPTKTTSYKALCTVNGCKSDSSTAVIITVISKPAQTKIITSNSSICAGGSSVLTASACTGGILSWTGNLTGSTVTVTPTKTTSYKALCTVNGCKSDSSTAVTITVTPKPATPVAKSNNASVCLGNVAILSATGCAGTLTWTGNLTGTSVTVTPTKTSTYKALCTVNGCKSDSSTAVTITVIPKPVTPVAKSNNSSVCLGTNAILSATGCAGTLTWTGNLTGSSVTVTPTKTSTYKALCTVNGCKSDSSLSTTITVLPKPVQPKITASNATICSGGSSVLTSSACADGTSTWSGGLTGTSITVSPTVTKSYKVVCTINGCKSDSSLATMITVRPKPNAPIITSNTCPNPILSQWNKTIKGNANDWLYAAIPTSDGGYLLGGISKSGISNDKSEANRGDYDYWIIKVNANGAKIWDKTFGGTKEDVLQSIVPTQDGGFVIAGYTISDISGDKTTSNKGSWDFWLVKIDSKGNKIWDKSLGGGLTEIQRDIVATNDGGFIVAGFSYSDIGGDKSEKSKGGADYWVIKINSNGTKVWDKTFGGNTDDQLTSITPTSDGGFIIGGYSNSNLGLDKTAQPKGGWDYWLLKINANGTKVWDKSFGGNFDDVLDSVVPTSDGGFLIGGASQTGINGDKSEASKGYFDYWILKIDGNGVKVWDKTLGSDKNDYVQGIVTIKDGGYLIGGSSYSGKGGDKSEDTKGDWDFWVIKVDALGNKIWDKTLGGSKYEQFASMVSNGTDEFLLAGYSESDISGDKSETSLNGDIWITKIKQVCDPNNLLSSQKPTLTATGCTGTVTWSNGATGSSITVSPTVATTYTATCTVNGCTSSVSNAISVSPSITGNSTLPIEAAKTARVETIQTEPSLGFKVFPNPATNEINIETDLDGESTFQLYNSIGQQVVEKTFVKKAKISISDIGRGNHFYLIQNQDFRSTGKILLE